MSLLSLAIAYVWRRPLVSLLTVLSVGLGTALVLVVVNVGRHAEAAFLGQTPICDLVIGPSGSESALVLTALFHADLPRGNVPLSVYEGLREQRGVVAAFPMSLGDRYREARIVGTVPEFLTQSKADGSPLFPLAEGRRFEADFELVAGAAAAARLNLKVGRKIVGTHGAAPARRSHDDHDHDHDELEHDDFPYTVVGILAPSGTTQDRALFTTLASYWKIHDVAGNGESSQPATEREVTVVLVRTNRSLLLQLQQLIPRKFGVMAVRPAEVLNQVFEKVLEPIEKVLLVYGYAVAAVAVASILTTLYLTTLSRRRDLAILRSIGAVPSEIFLLVLLEAFVLSVLGCGLGIVLSQAMGVVLHGNLQRRFGIELAAGAFTMGEVWTVVVIILAGLAAALAPALQAYRRDVSRELGRA